MIQENYKIISYQNVGSKRFGHWALIKDYRTPAATLGKQGRLNFIRTMEQSFGKLGIKWQYQKNNSNTFFIKFDSEKDLLLLMLKISKA